MKNYNDFCKTHECPEYLEWDNGCGKCISCKKVGESYDIESYPDDCLHLFAIQMINLDSVS